MFDIGFPELLLVSVVALLVLGPERLPEALRTLGLWLGRMRRSFNSVKTEIEREIGMDEIRRQLHNESVMQEMKRIEDDVKASTADLATVDVSGTAAGASGPAAGASGTAAGASGTAAGASGPAAGASGTGATGTSAGAADTEAAKPKPAETPAGGQADK